MSVCRFVVVNSGGDCVGVYTYMFTRLCPNVHTNVYV